MEINLIFIEISMVLQYERLPSDIEGSPFCILTKVQWFFL